MRRTDLPFLAVLLLTLALLQGCTSVPPVSPLPASYVTASGAEGRQLRTPDGLTLFGQWWVPADREPRAVVLLVHGTALHSGFYKPWADHLVGKGYAVFAIDLRGWGQSQGMGKRGYVRNYDEYIGDVRIAYGELRKRYPAQPVFLQGESLGGTVVLMMDALHVIPASGLILNAPAVKPNPGIGIVRAPGFLADFGLWGLGILGKMAPNSGSIPFLDTLSGFGFRDEHVRQRFINDPFCSHDALPAAYLTALSEATTRVEQNLASIQTPLIILQGTSDNLVPLSSSEFLEKNVGSEDKTLKIYPDMSHTTLHDSGRDAVWADIIGWMSATLRYHPAQTETQGRTATSSKAPPPAPSPVDSSSEPL